LRWTVHGHRDVYASDWVRVSLDDVEIPGGDRFEHHVVHFPRASVTAVVTDEAGAVLLLWRHRFITGTWGWEIPAGWGDPGEVSRTGFVGGYDALASRLIIVWPWPISQSFSYSAGGISPQAE
jgi:hypothetical protein